jgi:hypothetical protein
MADLMPPAHGDTFDFGYIHSVAARLVILSVLSVFANLVLIVFILAAKIRRHESLCILILNMAVGQLLTALVIYPVQAYVIWNIRDHFGTNPSPVIGVASMGIDLSQITTMAAITIVVHMMVSLRSSPTSSEHSPCYLPGLVVFPWVVNQGLHILLTSISQSYFTTTSSPAGYVAFNLRIFTAEICIQLYIPSLILGATILILLMMTLYKYAGSRREDTSNLYAATEASLGLSPVHVIFVAVALGFIFLVLQAPWFVVSMLALYTGFSWMFNNFPTVFEPYLLSSAATALMPLFWLAFLLVRMRRNRRALGGAALSGADINKG